MNTNEHEIMKLIRQGESLALEFKSDSKCLPDRELVAAVVAMANTEGGDLLLGVEDDGRITGLHPNHESITGLSALIANKTNPSISVRVEWLEVESRRVAPRSRNPQLADIIKRIGLAERTGRGIDRIYEGMLRYGRPSPDYSMSDRSTVTVQMFSADADPDFLKMILHQEEKTGGAISIDSLIILSRLREEHRLSTADLAVSVQKPETTVGAVLEKLMETGLVAAHGAGRSRTYSLSYSHTGQKATYLRPAGIDPIQQEQMVIGFIDDHGSITRADVANLCHLSLSRAYHLLKRLQAQGKIIQKGKMRHAVYTRNR